MGEINRRMVAGALLAAGTGAVPLAMPSGATAAGSDTLDVSAVVSAAAGELRSRYFNPDMANQLADRLLSRLQAGAYRARSGVELAARMTADLRALGQDQHLSVQFLPQAAPRENGSDRAEDDLEFPDFAWGVQTTARLQGNIGLLRITHFPGGLLAQAAEHYGAAMTLLKDTCALIIDFTNNHGGGTDAHGYFMSYFVEGEVELRRIDSRNEAPEIVKTSLEVEGPRYAQTKPIYIATSHITFSAGEGVTHDLRQYRHATVVGERTRGGGNAGNFVNLPFHFRIFIPTGSSPGADWEGVGIAPDVAAAPEQAVAVAHRLALQALLERETDPARQQVLRNVAVGRIENLSSFNFDRRWRL